MNTDVKQTNPNYTAAKYDMGKLRWELLMSPQGCPTALEGVVNVLTFAVTKKKPSPYLPHSWRTVPDAEARYTAALHRHLNKLAQGQEFDDETGLRHEYHAMCCLLFISQLKEEKANA